MESQRFHLLIRVWQRHLVMIAPGEALFRSMKVWYPGTHGENMRKSSASCWWFRGFQSRQNLAETGWWLVSWSTLEPWKFWNRLPGPVILHGYGSHGPFRSIDFDSWLTSVMIFPRRLWICDCTTSQTWNVRAQIQTCIWNTTIPYGSKYFLRG